jgi:hypothetical protein
MKKCTLAKPIVISNEQRINPSNLLKKRAKEFP